MLQEFKKKQIVGKAVRTAKNSYDGKGGVGSSLVNAGKRIVAGVKAAAAPLPASNAKIPNAKAPKVTKVPVATTPKSGLLSRVATKVKAVANTPINFGKSKALASKVVPKVKAAVKVAKPVATKVATQTAKKGILRGALGKFGPLGVAATFAYGAIENADQKARDQAKQTGESLANDNDKNIYEARAKARAKLLGTDKKTDKGVASKESSEDKKEGPVEKSKVKVVRDGVTKVTNREFSSKDDEGLAAAEIRQRRGTSTAEEAKRDKVNIEYAKKQGWKAKTPGSATEKTNKEKMDEAGITF